MPINTLSPSLHQLLFQFPFPYFTFDKANKIKQHQQNASRRYTEIESKQTDTSRCWRNKVTIVMFTAYRAKGRRAQESVGANYARPNDTFVLGQKHEKCRLAEVC